MTPQELADEVTARVLGVGADQYDQGDTQRFEEMALDDLFLWAFEELDDVVAYCVMLRIRLERLRVAVSKSLP